MSKPGSITLILVDAGTPAVPLDIRLRSLLKAALRSFEFRCTVCIDGDLYAQRAELRKHIEELAGRIAGLTARLTEQAEEDTDVQNITQTTSADVQLARLLDDLADSMNRVASAIPDLGPAERGLLARRLGRISADLSMLLASVDREGQAEPAAH